MSNTIDAIVGGITNNEELKKKIVNTINEIQGGKSFDEAIRKYSNDEKLISKIKSMIAKVKSGEFDIDKYMQYSDKYGKR